MSDRPTVVVGVCVAALFVPLLVPLLTGQVFTQFDLAWFHLPFRHVYREALAAGDAVIWTPAVYSGFYLHGEGQIGLWHPLHLVLYRLAPLSVAFNLEMVSSYVIGCAGMYWFLVRVALSRAAALLGAMMFAFSGFNLLHLSHMNAVAVGAHIPWLLVAADVLLRADTGRKAAFGFVGTAVLIGSQFLLGFPQLIWMTLVVVVPYAAFRAWRSRAWTRLAWFVAALVCGTAIGAAQVLPMLEVAATARRLGLSPLGYSLHPLNLVQLFSPYVFDHMVIAPPAEAMPHELSVYDSAFAAVLLAWLYVRRRDLTRRGAVAAALALAAAGVVLALGRHGGLYPLLAQLPGLDRFRAPARHILLVHLGLAALAAVAFDDALAVARRRQRLPWRALWPLTIPLAASLIALAWLGRFESEVGPEWSLTLIGPRHRVLGAVLMALTTALMMGAARGRVAALLLVPVVVALDLGTWGYRYVWESPMTSVGALMRKADVPPGFAQGTVYSRVPPADANLVLLRGYRLMTGYIALAPRRALNSTDETTRRLAGVGWAQDGSGWYRVPSPMPRARLVADARVSQDPGSDLDTIDIATTALVENPVGDLSLPVGRAEVIVDRPGRIVVDVSTTAPNLLVLTESFHHGWVASDEAISLTPVRVYGDYLGCVVEPGTTRVTLTFRPRSAAFGLRIALAGLLATTIGGWRLGRSGRPVLDDSC